MITIDGRRIGPDTPTYFVADIAANHDGSLDRAKALIRLAKEAGAEAAKFQHFTARTIVSDVGFRRLGRRLSHQSGWQQEVYDVYDAAAVPADWTTALRDECERVGITFFSAPYSLDAIRTLSPFMPAIKIGSGDVDWLEAIDLIARQGKPVLLATGAADLRDVQRAVETVRAHTDELVLMQCNTNYTADDDTNLDHLNLNVLRTFATLWPDVVLGLSDHTHGDTAVLGAVALGARVVERHFTDDNGRDGPDHRFALDPVDWRGMVDATRRLERALGSPVKVVAPNEKDTVIVQRRCLRAARDLPAGTVLAREDLDVLRPAPPGALRPSELPAVLGRALAHAVERGVELRPEDLEREDLEPADAGAR
jgi:N-acetylneuraminate synthase